MRTSAGLLLMLAVLLGPFAAGQALALDPARAITQFKHTSWTAEDGTPTNIWDIAQSPDGYLWLGAAGGLYRFDGVTFEPIPLADNDYSHSQHINALVVARSGELWVGYRRGGIAIFRDGKLRALPGTDRLSVLTMAQDQDGAVWAGLSDSQQNLARFIGGRRQTIGPSWNLPAGFVMDLHVSRDGTLWVAIDGSLSFLRRGAKRFERTDVVIGKGAGLTEDSSGRLWVSDSLGARPLPNVAKGESATPGATLYAVSDSARFARILFDRDGSLWGTTFATGIFRVAKPSTASGSGPRPSPLRAETYEAQDGLSSNKAVPILQDREGNIWIGTSAGLDRLRTANVVVEPGVARSSRFGYLQFVDKGGAVYVGDSDTLYRAGPGQAPNAIRDHLANPTALCQDKAGAIWLGTESALAPLDGAGPRGASPLLGGKPYTGCAADRRGNLWFALFTNGYARLAPQGWTMFPLPVRGSAAFLAIDNQDRVVLPTGRTISRIDPNGAVQTLQVDPKLSVGGVRSLYQGPKDFLVGCEFGLLRLTGDRFEALQVARFPWAQGIQGMVQTSRGETWIVGALGVVRLRTADLDKAFGDPRRPLNYQLFDLKDGLPGPPQQNGSRDAVVGGDGRIWVLTLEGVGWIDPAHIVRNTLPPPVSIRAVTADGRTYGDPRDLTLPKGASKLQIDYTALSLSIPERVRFRYQLEGVDKDWVEAGGRRQAFYTNLEPGHYRFRVVASNNDGVWNDKGATLAFAIPPTFVQTKLFAALCVLTLLGLVWGLYALRLRQLSDRIHGRLQDRMAERERIARELHDTLLQGIQGLMLRLQSVADQMPPDQRAREDLEQALDRADSVIEEGRDRVKSLRAENPGDLPKILAEVANRLELEPAVKVRVVAEGAPRRLHPLVCEEIERIAAEALFNSLRHAQARNVEIGVSYGRRALGVRFRDDGVGLDQTVLDSGGREGHFGLKGMNERARKIQAEFEIRSRPGAGAEIALTVPAAVAYLTVGRRTWPFATRRAQMSES